MTAADGRPGATVRLIILPRRYPAVPGDSDLARGFYDVVVKLSDTDGFEETDGRTTLGYFTVGPIGRGGPTYIENFGARPMGGVENADPGLVRVLDALPNRRGPMLVELRPETVPMLRASNDVFTVTPLRKFTVGQASQPIAAPGPASLDILVVDANSGVPVTDAEVTGYVDFPNAIGDKGVTDSSGSVTLKLCATPGHLDRLYVHCRQTYWGAYHTGLSVGSNPLHVLTTPIDPTVPDQARHLYSSATGDGAGVRVGVIDTGITHPHVDPAFARNTVTGEVKGDTADNGTGHGTHVGGLIGARGAASGGVDGLATGAEIYSYRAFAAGTLAAENWDIMKAVAFAADDECDLINLSLGNMTYNRDVQVMVDDVNCKGAVMIAAAGNDHGSAVWAPASDPDVLAVTAMGRTGAFPAGALAESHVGLPSTSDPSDFFAAFSNLGNDVDLVSPGVGVVSTFPPAGLAAMDGTSQATAVATAVAARKLGAYPAILALPRDIHRSISIRNLLLSHSTTTAGFPPTHEGYGRLI